MIDDGSLKTSPSSDPKIAGSLGAHTPGPWRADTYDSDPREGEDKDEVALLPHAAYDAVNVYAPARIHTGPQSCDYAEFEANCRLIAAAPDLLDALREFRGALWECGCWDSWEHLEADPAVRKIDAALRKATGGSPIAPRSIGAIAEDKKSEGVNSNLKIKADGGSDG